MTVLQVNQSNNEAVVFLSEGERVCPERHGARAARLAQLASLGLPVPTGMALSFDHVRILAEAGLAPVLPERMKTGLLALRSSPRARDWGGPPAIIGIGSGRKRRSALAARLGLRAVLEVERRFVLAYAIRVEELDPEPFEMQAAAFFRSKGVLGPEELGTEALEGLLSSLRAAYADAAGRAFPEEIDAQLGPAIRAMARAWEAPTARILRSAKGAPEGAELGLVLQDVAVGIASGASGSGRLQAVDSQTGMPAAEGFFVSGALGPEARRTRERRKSAGMEGSLDVLCPEALAELKHAAEAAAIGCGDAMALDFALEDGQLAVLDAVPAARSTRGSVRIAVDLVKAGAIKQEDALLRVEPLSLVEQLHPAIAPAVERDVFGRGVAASPGAAVGRIVFTAEAAQAAAAQDEPGILVRAETSPEDIRGMHAALAVLTMRGGMSSHAAVIARGLGLPCVVGAGDLKLDSGARTLTAQDGRVFHEGTIITLDGTRGEVLSGAQQLVQPLLDPAFVTLLDWADMERRLGVRANADTPAEARVARSFGAEGIGLCRTEHMFFETDRVTVMGEMILADTAEERRAALDRLLPMQRADFKEIFAIMAGLPVTIRLLDPPLHEFLPSSKEEMQSLAEAIGVSVEQVQARAVALAEVNPMLGLRGVRLGITIPEIYEMQARAIFEAAVAVNRRGGAPVVPEIMIPLVSANREVELIKARIEAVAQAVEVEQAARSEYRIGVMIETPRAALRAGELAAMTTFLSFGTNDLTQMTYGLSRDDAGRFMRAYVSAGVFAEDPFHSLDLEGVGELLLMAARRGRARNSHIALGLCGEHGGDPASIQFCELAGLDYLSCSPFRVPIARLAAAQATILANFGKGER